MKQFDVYANTDKDTNEFYPYFVDVQSDLISSLNTRVVIPLVLLSNADIGYPENLCPLISMDGNMCALLTQQISSVSTVFLKKRIGSILSDRDAIVSALDFLITGI